MVYMSKTKRKRVRRQRLIRLAIAAAVVAAVLVIIWQASLGSVVARVEGTTIRSGMVDGVETFLAFAQTGQFPNNSTAGMTEDEIATQNDLKLVQRNALVQSVFVTNEVIRKFFAEKGIAFPDEEQQAQIDEYVEMYFGTPEAVRTLEAKGVKRQHIEYYFEFVTIMAALRNYIDETDPVTEEEALAYYNENPSYFTNPFSMSASHILIQDPEHTDAKRAEIEAILEKLNNGADFAELAMEYSECGSAENGGDLGTFGLGQMVPEFEEAALALEPGEISGIVETQFGFHIIKLTEKTEESIAPFEDVRENINSVLIGQRSNDLVEGLIDAANITYSGLINPETGRPPTSLADLALARGETPDAEHDPNDGGDHTGHNHD